VVRRGAERRPADEPLFDAVLAAMDSFPHDVEVVRQAALARASLIDGDRAAGHVRLVQASFAAVITDFVRDRYRQVPDVDLVAEVAGATVAAALIVARRSGAATSARRPVRVVRRKPRAAQVGPRAAQLKGLRRSRIREP
jgi:hypothetical protein